MTKFTNTNNLDKKVLAQNLADLIQPDFKAYQANPDDDSIFVIDTHNNWRVNFSKNDNTFDISYRYGEKRQVEIINTFKKKLNKI